MELRKKSILIALCIGDGYITHQRHYRNGRMYQYNYLEISHGYKQIEYTKWKAALCSSITGKKCTVHNKKHRKHQITPNGKIYPESIGATFTCTSPYFRILRKWLYPNGVKKLSSKYLSYLTPEGLAIWYMDDGCTYIHKKSKGFSVEFSTHIEKVEAEDLINMFKEKWNIKFRLHKVHNNKYNLRTYCSEAFKFIQLIEPFVPHCMGYKLKVPQFYFQECTTSHLNKIN